MTLPAIPLDVEITAQAVLITDWNAGRRTVFLSPALRRFDLTPRLKIELPGADPTPHQK